MPSFKVLPARFLTFLLSYFVQRPPGIPHCDACVRPDQTPALFRADAAFTRSILPLSQGEPEGV